MISFNNKKEGLEKPGEAERLDRSTLFPNASVNKMYYIEVRARLQTTKQILYLALFHDNSVVRYIYCIFL